MKTKKSQQPSEAVPQIDTSFLLSKVDQSASTRSTFTISRETDVILNKLSEDADITQRELFDQAVSNGWLKMLAEQIQGSTSSEDRTIRRTLVMSGSALEQLQNTARDAKIKRDELACAVIKRMLESYNRQVKVSKEQWSQIKIAIDNALWDAISEVKALESLERSDIPEQHRASVKRCVVSMLNGLSDVIHDEDDPLRLNGHIRGEISDLRTIAEDLEPIEIIEEDYLTSKERLERLLKEEL